jgi:Bacterial extracellular solute-binding proteins, family 5 Middle
VITWRKNGDPRTQISAILSGHADATEGLNAGFAPTITQEQRSALAADLQTRYPRQFHTESAWSTAGEGMNLRLRPFDDIRVRHALNYAADRRKIAALEGGAMQAEATCQVLPPQFPGYRPYCPYTKRPLDGTYHGPDPAMARQLVAACPARRLYGRAFPGYFGPQALRELEAMLSPDTDRMAGEARWRNVVRKTDYIGSWIFDDPTPVFEKQRLAAEIDQPCPDPPVIAEDADQTPPPIHAHSAFFQDPFVAPVARYLIYRNPSPMTAHAHQILSDGRI